VVLALVAAAVFAISASSFDQPTARAEKPWIIDTHTHFKGEQQVALERRAKRRDPRDTLGRVVVPEDFRQVADRLGIQSTIIVEAVEQEHPQFNRWVLGEAKSDLVCGYVARGDLVSEAFGKNYEEYRASGYLLGYRFRFDELHGYLDNPAARRNLQRLERDGMVVDLLVEPPQAKDVLRLAGEFPKLKIVINHCFRARMKDGETSPQWRRAVSDCGKHSNVYCKISSIVNFSEAAPFGRPAPSQLDPYLPVLQPCFDAFGEDRMIFATNWGVCTHFGKVDDVVGIVTQFLESQSKTALKKGMRDNAIRIYGIDPKHLR
ncbi:MAG: amidohydrolase family protein, partial [Pirellulaceae bacterium]|nr:amidohydrolase family protein [Pirellulaceae bacterium]